MFIGTFLSSITIEIDNFSFSILYSTNKAQYKTISKVKCQKLLF